MYRINATDQLTVFVYVDNDTSISMNVMRDIGLR